MIIPLDESNCGDCFKAAIGTHIEHMTTQTQDHNEIIKHSQQWKVVQQPIPSRKFKRVKLEKMCKIQSICDYFDKFHGYGETNLKHL